MAWFPSACSVRAYAVRATSRAPVLNPCQISRPRAAERRIGPHPGAAATQFEFGALASTPKSAVHRASGRPADGPEHRGIVHRVDNLLRRRPSGGRAIERLGDPAPYHRLRHARCRMVQRVEIGGPFWLAALCTVRRSRHRSPGGPRQCGPRCQVFSVETRRRPVDTRADSSFALLLCLLRNSWPETDTRVRQLRVPIDI
jgi:hypothetical protein